MKFEIEIFGTKIQLMADLVSKETISDAPTQLFLKSTKYVQYFKSPPRLNAGSHI